MEHRLFWLSRPISSHNNNKSTGALLTNKRPNCPKKEAESTTGVPSNALSKAWEWFGYPPRSITNESNDLLFKDKVPIFVIQYNCATLIFFLFRTYTPRLSGLWFFVFNFFTFYFTCYRLRHLWDLEWLQVAATSEDKNDFYEFKYIRNSLNIAWKRKIEFSSLLPINTFYLCASLHIVNY